MCVVWKKWKHQDVSELYKQFYAVNRVIPVMSVPKPSTLANWQKKHEWLLIEENTMYCRLCMKYENNISSVKGFTKKFIDGSATSLKYIRVCEHEAGEPHKAAKKRKDQDDAKERGEAYRVEVPSDAPIVQGLKRMRESEHRGIQKLFDVAYYIAKQGRPLTDFESLIALEKMHGVDFVGTSCENWKVCRNFLLSISNYFFEKNVRDKILRSNFITIMFDGTTESAVSEQEVIFLLYFDPDELEPRMSFFYLQQLHGGQDADILKDAIEDAFKKNEMTDAIQKIVFFGSDGTNTNSGLKTGLITKLKDDISWIQFIWCVSHRLELSMKDALKEFMKPVDDSLVHLYYLFKKSSKKLSQLKSLLKDLESVHDFESKSIKPEKSSGLAS